MPPQRGLQCRHLDCGPASLQQQSATHAECRPSRMPALHGPPLARWTSDPAPAAQIAPPLPAEPRSRHAPDSAPAAAAARVGPRCPPRPASHRAPRRVRRHFCRSGRRHGVTLKQSEKLGARALASTLALPSPIAHRGAAPLPTPQWHPHGWLPRSPSLGQTIVPCGSWIGASPPTAAAAVPHLPSPGRHEAGAPSRRPLQWPQLPVPRWARAVAMTQATCLALASAAGSLCGCVSKVAVAVVAGRQRVAR